ncbi:hypothetical protein BASA81_006493 [Batrachochytrium salamandrivorans]|nr:hypothetical protein BASA81_006493 [Batrachochytrium salamandrivorans]
MSQLDLPSFTAAEVAKHNSPDDCWIVIDNVVYNVTEFLNKHPGGSGPLEDQAGTDTSYQFRMHHGEGILERSGKKYIVGRLTGNDKNLPPNTWKEPVFQPGPVPSPTSGGTSHLLPAERKRATFDVDKMSDVLYDGAAEKRRFILHPTKAITAGYKKYDMTREEAISKHVEDFVKIHRPYTLEGYRPENANEVSWMSEMATNSGSMMPHYGLFLPTILGQGSPEQMMAWAPRALTFQIVGSYAQTELSHGSNVRGLQTTATYDEVSQCFIMHTPCLGATKWWNSNAGIVATHGAVFAQLITKGKEHGVHVFFVQLRDENHRFLPGVMAGDVGVKMGDNTIDTSWIQFDHVKVPREHLMGKRQHVEPDGTYVKHTAKGGNEHAHYLTMMNARAGMVNIASGKLAIGATIAARYSCVRLQGFTSNASNVSFRSEENAIIEYQNQRYRVLKAVANSYCMRMNGTWMALKMRKLQTDVLTPGAVSDEDFQEVHVAAAAMKGIVTLMAHLGIEDCRKACGGHGFLLNSGIGLLSGDYSWQVTAEGDYIVMLLQAGRYLLKSYHTAKRGEKLTGMMECLLPLRDPKFNPSSQKKASASTTAQIRNHQFLLDLFRHRLLSCVFRVGQQFDEKMKRNGNRFEDAFNSCSLNLQTSAVSFGMYFMLKNFVEVAERETDQAISAALGRLVSLFALSEILDGKQWFGLIDASESDLVNDAVVEILDELRPDVVALVDAFDIPDAVLNSTIGRSDGNVYEALFDAAFHAPLNATPNVPFKGYEELRKSLDLDFLKLHNRPCPELNSRASSL